MREDMGVCKSRKRELNYESTCVCVACEGSPCVRELRFGRAYVCERGLVRVLSTVGSSRKRELELQAERRITFVLH